MGEREREKGGEDVGFSFGFSPAPFSPSSFSPPSSFPSSPRNKEMDVLFERVIKRLIKPQDREREREREKQILSYKKILINNWFDSLEEVVEGASGESWREMGIPLGLRDALVDEV